MWCVDGDVCKRIWDRALKKTAYVPLLERIRSECNSRCGWTSCLEIQNIWGTPCLEVQNMWLWTSCVEVQKSLIGKVLSVCNNPKKVCQERFNVFTNNPKMFVVVRCLCCVPWLVILVVYLDLWSRLCTLIYQEWKDFFFLNHFENSFVLKWCRWEFWENNVFFGRHVWQTQGCKTKPFSSTLKEIKSLNPYKHFRLSL